MRRLVPLLAGLVLMLATGNAIAATNHATVTRCPSFTLPTLQYLGTTGYGPGSPTPVRRISARGLDCTAVHALFAGARVPISGGGANYGVAWGRGLTPSPAGWSCETTVGYWAARHHADTFDWIHGWTESCRAPGRMVSFTEGLQTPWRLRAQHPA